MYAITNAALTQKAAIGGRAVRLNRQKAAVRRFTADSISSFSAFICECE